MQITFDLPHVFYPGSSSEENAYVLRALLDCLVTINLTYLRNHPTPQLYRSGVIYARTTVWDSIPAIRRRSCREAPMGYGDCKSLTAWRIAELKKNGYDARPVFRWIERADDSGIKDFHILVQMGNVFEDPSKKCGMGSNENARFAGRR